VLHFHLVTVTCTELHGWRSPIHSQAMRPWNSKLPGVECCECSYPLDAIDNAKFSQRDQRNKNFTEEETIAGERKSGCTIYWAKVCARAWVQMDMLRILQMLGGPNSNSSIRHLHQEILNTYEIDDQSSGCLKPFQCLHMLVKCCKGSMSLFEAVLILFFPLQKQCSCQHREELHKLHKGAD